MAMLKYKLRIESNRLAAIARKLPLETQTAVAETLSDIETGVKLSMREAKSGRFYRRGKDRIHLASAAGQAPAIDYGHLIDSIQQKLYKTVIGGEVFTNSEYAEPLEFGTRKMAPRPSMAPALEAQRENFYAKLRALERKL
jgi:HK97 gp10 family phage protein